MQDVHRVLMRTLCVRCVVGYWDKPELVTDAPTMLQPYCTLSLGKAALIATGTAIRLITLQGRGTLHLKERTGVWACKYSMALSLITQMLHNKATQDYMSRVAVEDLHLLSAYVTTLMS